MGAFFVGKINKNVIQITDCCYKKKYLLIHKYAVNIQKQRRYKEERKLFFLRTQKEELPFFV